LGNLDAAALTDSDSTVTIADSVSRRLRVLKRRIRIGFALVQVAGVVRVSLVR
jgi:uncharacterized heparinase superfamily protein